MAKKQTKKAEVEQPEIKATNEMQEVVIKEPVVDKQNNEESWEIKDRMYYLRNNKTPLTYLIRGSNIFYFDEKLGYERELKYTSNQRTCFVDEMKGEQRLEHIIFQNGQLFVPKTKTVLQKLLSLYHPHNGKLFEEHKPVEVAAQEIDILELEVEALVAARSLDIDIAEAVMRVELGSKVTEMSSKELKRDLLLYAKRNPSLFLELVNDDNVMLRNFGIKASNDRKLMTVPFDEHPYSALAAWFKTDEGMEIYSNIEKRLNA